MDFVTGLLNSTDLKGESYDSILVIVDRLIKMVHYKLLKVIIDALGLVKVILDVVVQHYSLPDSMVINRGSLFTSKFWLLLYYFLGIKRRLSTAFYPQTDGQTKRENSTMEAYLRAFINFKQNDWVRLLSMAEFTYNNAKNASIDYTPFELNCGYHSHVFYKENVDPCSKSKSAEDLANDLRELMMVYWDNL